MLFAIHTMSRPGSGDVIAALNAEHRAYLATRAADVRLGGPLLDPVTGDRIGGLLLMEFESHGEAERYFAEQPYAKAGIIEKILIHPFEVLTLSGLEAASS